MLKEKDEPGLWGPDGLLAIPNVKMVLFLASAVQVTHAWYLAYTKHKRSPTFFPPPSRLPPQLTRDPRSTFGSDDSLAGALVYRA